ncbi:MAG: murein L,D-transpeptidase catalytic domain family protein [Sphingobacteriales bacterium]|nr:MAG: murein L,D-transpeptidase catalytic domain family protein [Sphingobacteriales bacterium]
MKKLVLCASVCLSIIGTSYKLVIANDNTSAKEVVVVTEQDGEPAINVMSQVNNIDQHIKDVYSQIDFSKSKKLDFDVFQKAYHGYINLRNSGKLSSDKDILTVCDFSKSSTAYRLWVIDLREKKVLINDYVAHGQGSGDEFATMFSNTNSSHQSSLGFYVTGDTYVGKHGTSLRLHGMDKGFNNAAYERAVVIHGAAYVCDQFVAGQKRLGRSWGCPAVSDKIAGKMINTIKEGTCVFVYAPQKNYLQSSVWLNSEIVSIPVDFNMEKRAIASVQVKADSNATTIIQ